MLTYIERENLPYWEFQLKCSPMKQCIFLKLRFFLFEIFNIASNWVIVLKINVISSFQWSIYILIKMNFVSFNVSGFINIFIKYLCICSFCQRCVLKFFSRILHVIHFNLLKVDTLIEIFVPNLKFLMCFWLAFVIYRINFLIWKNPMFIIKINSF